MNTVPRPRPGPLAKALLLALAGIPALPPPAFAGACDATAQCIARQAPPALELAGTYRPGIAVADYWVSEKLDGIRAYWDGERLITRRGNPIHAPAWFVADLPPVPLDGELWLGRGRFEELVATVRDNTPDPAAWRQVRYRVFDLPASPAPFGARRLELERLLADARNPWAQAVAQQRVADRPALLALLNRVVDRGGEGLVLHRDGALHRAGRSRDLLKLKPYRDAEARVLARLPGRGRLRGLMGSLLVEMEDGRRFRIGTGFSDAQRRNPPPVGSTITFKYQGLTARGIPRFASYLRVREEL